MYKWSHQAQVGRPTFSYLLVIKSSFILILQKHQIELKTQRFLRLCDGIAAACVFSRQNKPQSIPESVLAYLVRICHVNHIANIGIQVAIQQQALIVLGHAAMLILDCHQGLSLQDKSRLSVRGDKQLAAIPRPRKGGHLLLHPAC